MTVKDWITYPRTEGGWTTKANAWMNELVDCINGILTRVTTTESDITTLQADVDALENDTWQGYTPTVNNLGTVTVNVGNYATHLGTTIVSVNLTQNGGTPLAGAIQISLPVAVESTWLNRFGTCFIHAEDVSANQHYIGTAKLVDITGTTYVEIWDVDGPGSGGDAEGVWTGTAAPFVWASGDTISFTIVMRTT